MRSIWKTTKGINFFSCGCHKFKKMMVVSLKGMFPLGKHLFLAMQKKFGNFLSFFFCFVFVFTFENIKLSCMLFLVKKYIKNFISHKVFAELKFNLFREYIVSTSSNHELHLDYVVSDLLGNCLLMAFVTFFFLCPVLPWGTSRKNKYQSN